MTERDLLAQQGAKSSDNEFYTPFPSYATPQITFYVTFHYK